MVTKKTVDKIYCNSELPIVIMFMHISYFSFYCPLVNDEIAKWKARSWERHDRQWSKGRTAVQTILTGKDDCVVPWLAVNEGPSANWLCIFLKTFALGNTPLYNPSLAFLDIDLFKRRFPVLLSRSVFVKVGVLSLWNMIIKESNVLVSEGR